MKTCLATLFFLTHCLLAETGRTLIIVPGNPGNETFRTTFTLDLEHWQDFAEEADFDLKIIEGTNQKTKLQQTLAALPPDGEELWLVLLGHGSYDGRTAKFNLIDADITPEELATQLTRFTRKIISLNFFAASATFTQPLAAENRIILASTVNERERNYSHYGTQFAKILAQPTDLDSNGEISLLEAARQATRNTRSFYDNEQRNLTEHASIEDDNDGKPTPIEDWNFNQDEKPKDGTAANKVLLFPSNATEKFPKHLIEQRAAIEARLEELKLRKETTPEQAYYLELEKILLEMAELYRQAENQ